MINIFITNLGKYNEGELIGEWVKLPVSDSDFQAVLDRIGINEQYEEYFISDYESDVDNMNIGEYDSIDDLNELAESLEQLDDDTKNKVIAIMAYNGNNYDFQDAFNDLQDSIDYSGCNDMSDVAYQILEEDGTLDGLPEVVRISIDFESAGDYYDTSGTFIPYDGGYLQLL